MAATTVVRCPTSTASMGLATRAPPAASAISPWQNMLDQVDPPVIRAAKERAVRPMSMFHRRPALWAGEVHTIAARVAAHAVISDPEQQPAAGTAAALRIPAGRESMTAEERFARAGPGTQLAGSTTRARHDRQLGLYEITRKLTLLDRIATRLELADERRVRHGSNSR